MQEQDSDVSVFDRVCFVNKCDNVTATGSFVPRGCTVLDVSMFSSVSKEHVNEFVKHLLRCIGTTISLSPDCRSYTIHVFAENLTISTVMKHHALIQKIAHCANLLEATLDTCVIHDAPFVIRQVLELLRPLMTAETVQKIIVHRKPTKKGNRGSSPSESCIESNEEGKQTENQSFST